MRSFRSVIMATAAAAVLTACGGPASGGEPVVSGSTLAGSSAQDADTLRFTATTVDGAQFAGSSLAGRDAVLWFWAPWCTECRREAPHVAAVQASTKDTVTFVGVAGLGDTPDMRAFVTDYRVGAFAQVADLDGAVWKRFGVTQQPAYAFIDDSGAVEVVRGELGEQGLAAKVAALTGD